MGLNEQTDVISKYVTDGRLQNILREIENSTGSKFTDTHFQKEISMSGQIKQEGGKLSNDAISAFNKMKNESGCNDIFIKDPKISYRSYDDQKDQFLQEASKSPQGVNKIEFALKRVAIPGYSQHHTGKSIDYGGNTICLREKAWPNGDFNKPNKWGFTLPYMSGNIRMQEPWHLFYEGTSSNNQQTNITTIEELNVYITGQTFNKNLDLNSIKLDVDKKTFSVSPGDTPVYKIVLRWNLPNETSCVSCENTITKNPEYGAKSIKQGKWENNTRIYSLIVLYPPKKQ